jgi:recombination protein RecA
MGLEQMEMALKALPTGSPPSVLAWDSIAATPTKKEVEQGTEAGAEMGERARLLSRACRILIPLAARKRVALLFVNQTRSKIGVMYGDPETTPGGAAVKFHASFRMRMSEGKAIKDGEQHKGKYVNVQARKNRFAEPHRKAALRMDFFDGWNDDWSTLEFAKERGLIDAKSHGAKALLEARLKLGWSAALPAPQADA